MSDRGTQDDSGDDLFEEEADDDEDAEAMVEVRLEAGEGEVEAENDVEEDEVEIVRVERRTSAEVETGIDDFQTPKKRRKVRHTEKRSDDGEKKPAADLNDSMDSSEACPICFESWTNSGDHRLSSLKCGHLFGYGCIGKWLMGPGKACPQCNAPAKKKDIRVIYAKRLMTIDTAELDRVRVELANERHLRLMAEREAASYRLQASLVTEECSRMRQTLDLQQSLLDAAGQAAIAAGTAGSTGQAANLLSARAVPTAGAIGANYYHVATIRLADGACRVMTPCDYMNTLCIAQASPNPLFRGFGIRKIHLHDHHMDRFLVLHSQPIRDLALHPDLQDGLLLSVSMDKTAKLVSLFTGQVVQTYSCPLPVWSCCWHRDCHFQFFAGLSNGQVLQFDTRRLSMPMASHNLATSLTPVCALQYAPRATESGPAGACFRHGGLFVGQLDRVTFLAELSANQAAAEELPPPSASSVPLLPTPVTPGFRSHPLPLEGSLVSLSFEPHTRHLLASFRPSRCQAALATVRHMVCQMSSSGTGEDAAVTCNLLHTLTAGRCLQRMTRSRLYRGPENRLLAASGDEETLSTLVWDAAQAQRSQQLQGGGGGTVLDVAPFDSSTNGHGLVSLSESAVQFFRWGDPS